MKREGIKLRAFEFLRGILNPYAIVFKHVLKKPHTIKYPYERLRFSDGFRGRITLDLNKCNGCGLCARICPNKAIEMIPLEEWDFKLPEINFGKSSFCGLCVEACPVNALKETEIVELSTTKREDLVYSPLMLSEFQPLEEIFKELKKMLSVKIEGHKISYIEEGELEK